MFKTFLFLSITLIYGCSSYLTVDKYNKDREILESKIDKLKEENNLYKVKVESFSNKMMVLENRVLKLIKERDNLVSVKNSIDEKKEDSLKKEVEPILNKNETTFFQDDKEDEEPIILTNSMIEERDKKHYSKKEDKKDSSDKNTKKLVRRFSMKKLKKEYSNALSFYQNKKYAESIEEFNKLIKKYKTKRNSLTDNFYYWIGENYLALNDIPLARKYFNIVLKDYPKQNKVPDSIYKLGELLEREGRSKDALKFYKKVSQKYPNTEAGKEGVKKLKLLNN